VDSHSTNFCFAPPSNNTANRFDVSDTDVMYVSDYLIIHRDKAFVGDESPQEQHLRIAIFDLLKFIIVQQWANITSTQRRPHESPREFLQWKSPRMYSAKFPPKSWRAGTTHKEGLEIAMEREIRVTNVLYHLHCVSAKIKQINQN
jgi:hypothetical protein